MGQHNKGALQLQPDLSRRVACLNKLQVSGWFGVALAGMHCDNFFCQSPADWCCPEETRQMVASLWQGLCDGSTLKDARFVDRLLQQSAWVWCALAVTLGLAASIASFASEHLASSLESTLLQIHVFLYHPRPGKSCTHCYHSDSSWSLSWYSHMLPYRRRSAGVRTGHCLCFHPCWRLHGQRHLLRLCSLQRHSWALAALLWRVSGCN